MYAGFAESPSSNLKLDERNRFAGTGESCESVALRSVDCEAGALGTDAAHRMGWKNGHWQGRQLSTLSFHESFRQPGADSGAVFLRRTRIGRRNHFVLINNFLVQPPGIHRPHDDIEMPRI